MTKHEWSIAPIARTSGILLSGIVAGAIILRMLAALVLQQTDLQGDPLAYFTMANSLVEQGKMADQFGNRAFMSAGYPLVLAPFFALFGGSLSVVLLVNMLLTALSVWLIYRLALELSGRYEAGLVAAALYALWFAGVWNAARVAKENLSTPLLLALALCALPIARGQNSRAVALVAGLLWGASLITGGSSVLLCLGIAVALILLWRREGRLMPAFNSGLCFMLGAAVLLAPWLYATDQMVGRPVLATNASFNLYLGNNPAATGKFVSIADTPLADGWEAARRERGELGNSDRLQREALNWIAANPVRSAELTALKLAYFWEPNIPDAEDFAASKAISSVRVFEVMQYLAICILGFLAFRTQQITSDGKLVVAAMIAGFWVVHAVMYIIMRYRDPAIPLLIAMASVPVAEWLQRMTKRRVAHGG